MYYKNHSYYLIYGVLVNLLKLSSVRQHYHNQYRIVVQKRAVTYQSKECTNESTPYSSMLTRSPGEEAPTEHVDLGRSIMFLV